MSTNTFDRKLTYKELIGLPLANFGPTLQTCIQMYFLLYFFTNVLGISGTAAAIIIMVARIWDFINDPLMAVLVEKTQKPERCLLWMKAALIPTCVFMVLTYTAPHFSTAGKIVWATVVFIGLGMSQTAYSIPLNSLRPTLTTDRVQRNRLNRMEQIVGIAGNILIPSVTMPLIAVLQGFNVSAPFMALAAIYAAVYFILATIGLRMLKGHDHSVEMAQGGAGTNSKIGISQMISAMFTNKAAMLVLMAQLLKMFISSISASCMTYYYQYNIGNVNVMSVVSTLGGLVGLVPILFLPSLYKKLGNAGTALSGAVIALAGMSIRFFTHDASVGIIYAATVIEYMGTQMISAMLMQCLMDAIDYGEWKTGKKNVPVIMSTYGMGTKIGLAFGTTIAGLIVGALNFDPSVAVQPDRVLNSFFFIMVTLLLIEYACLAGLFVFLRKIEKKLPQMRAEIENGTSPGASKLN